MKAVILAAGEGKRLRPLTLLTPKPMIEVLGRPLLHHIIDSLPKEITELIIVIGYKGEEIRNYFGDVFEGKRVTYIIQPKQLGNADALALCKPYLAAGERFLFMFADDLHSPAALKKLLRHELGALVKEHPDPSRFGVVEVDGKDRVISVVEKPKDPKSNLVLTGVYVLDDRIFHYTPSLHESGEYYMTDQVNQLIREHRFVIERTDFWFPVSTPADIARAEEVVRAQKGVAAAGTFDMPVIILCGGAGTRLPEAEKSVPKLLVPIAGKPMLAHQLDNLAKQEAGRIVLSLGHRASDIVAWLTAQGKSDISYVIEQKPLGTGGGIRLASRGIREPFVAINGDSLGDFNLGALARHSSGGRFAVICGVEVGDASDFGSITCDEHKRICAFVEKKPNAGAGIINAGAYVLRPKDFEGMPEAFSIERDLFPKLAALGELVLATHTGNYWFDCGTSERLKAVREYFSKSH